MSDYIDTRDGWRLWPRDEPFDGRRSLVERDEHGVVLRKWAREDPPLPTEPYTVVRVTWPDGEEALFVHDGDRTRPISTNAWVDSVAAGSRVETLAEPRTVTAKAVLDAFERANWDTSTSTVDAIARDFGVES